MNPESRISKTGLTDATQRNDRDTYSSREHLPKSMLMSMSIEACRHNDNLIHDSDSEGPVSFSLTQVNPRLSYTVSVCSYRCSIMRAQVRSIDGG
ncbi:hypothetical protein E4T56_gene17196 [Termitomyces sp. T112]|nr:hypothetical protein E4T56_gene17196 [Termitomyces sp. T112]